MARRTPFTLVETEAGKTYEPAFDKVSDKTLAADCKLNQALRVNMEGNLLHLWLEERAQQNDLEGDCLATQEAMIEAFNSINLNTKSGVYGYRNEIIVML